MTHARVGSVLALSYGDAIFDAVWGAATSQYLTDDELTTMLAELRRVVRPGGLVAIKDIDATVLDFFPAPPIVAHLFEAMAESGNAPLRDVERQYMGDGLAYFAPTALQRAVPAADRAVWEWLTEAAGRDRLFDDPDFSWREGHVVVVGIAP